MAKSLIIVESPTKARTIERILGKDYSVVSSNGHIIDLPKKELAVDVDDDFSLKNRVIPSKRKALSAISKAAKNADRILMATDPDREGEAIAYLLAEHLKLPEDKVFRVLFHEITKKGILQALENPGKPDNLKFEAQQSRRAIDRLVGYKLSPLLWKKIKRGLSAGRVQSVALRLICEREREIRAFVPEDYWHVYSHLEGDTPPIFRVRLATENGKKIRITDEELAFSIRDQLPREAFHVEDVKIKKANKRPSPPFITSTLQQEAARKLGFTAKKTMVIAQQLYEGVNLGKMGTTGLITYMRTDSVRVSADAVGKARDEIVKRFGSDHVPTSPRLYKNRKGAQDAHEAVRPSNPELDPDSVSTFLEKDQNRLYDLIYKRFIASQMSDAILEKTRVDVKAGPYGLTASGQRVLFTGFTALYEEGKDEDPDNEASLPKLEKGQVLTLREVEVEKKTTKPPPRYMEATLVRELEEKGIGRPSTYASILDTIQKRNYVIKDKRRFAPTALGMAVNDYLVLKFPRLVDFKFTAQMEDELDSIQEGEKTYKNMLDEFYSPFSKELDEAEKDKERFSWGHTDLKCPDCPNGSLVIRTGRMGEFLACSNYPDCKFTSNFVTQEDGSIEPVKEQEREELCPECGSPMVLRQGRSGPFLGCSRYPDCKGTLPLSTGVSCPEEGCSGELIHKRSKKGRTFFGCSSFPDCRYAVWDDPVSVKCPQCGFSIMTRKVQRAGPVLVCPVKDCGHRISEDETG
ncbi:MAG: type I DNA topoisomerase, partial [bacterium]